MFTLLLVPACAVGMIDGNDSYQDGNDGLWRASVSKY